MEIETSNVSSVMRLRFAVGLISFMVAPLQAGPEATWGEPNEVGVVSRIVRLTHPPQIGKPILVRVDFKNTGTKPYRAVLPNVLDPDDMIAIVDEKGKAVPVISPMLAGCVRTNFEFKIAPGATGKLVHQFDLAEEFEIMKAGSYQCQFPGFKGKDQEEAHALPPSPILKIDIRAGKVPVDVRMIAKLRPFLPADWIICRRWQDDGAFLGHEGEKGSVRIHLTAADPKAQKHMEDEHKRLGTGPLGEIRIGAMLIDGKGGVDLLAAGTLEEHWPGVYQTLREALSLVSPET